MFKVEVRVENVSLMYNLSRQREERLKEYIINMIKGRLFFDPFWGLKDISFNLRAGDSLGIIGKNGAGKSTLLKLVSGVIKPTKGQVYTNGIIAPMVELGIALDHNMTAKENIFFLGAMHGFKKKYLNGRYERIIEFAELQDFADVPLRNFSSGMAARLSFSVATLINPDILVADEALAVGDIGFSSKCRARLDEIRHKGAIILFCSHSMDMVKSVCEKTLWLDHGTMMMYGDSNEVCNAYEQFMSYDKTKPEEN